MCYGINGIIDLSKNATKMKLMTLLFNCNSVNVVKCSFNGIVGVLTAIDREDGSGNKFNIRISTNEGPKTVFVRTID